MEHFKKLMAKKRQEGKGALSNSEASARHSVLDDMVGALDQDGMKKVKGIKKVTVASDKPEGLEKGLDLAKKLVSDFDKKKSDSLQKHEGEMADDSEEEEYDDQDSEGPNHMPTEKEASSFGSQDPALGSPETDEESSEEEASEEDELSRLRTEHEQMKKEIERLKAPKPFY